ncbi:MAG TPA: BTAD domain-containing putative transcriptional regulator, partial [Solirubrobacteraceae bacterium]
MARGATRIEVCGRLHVEWEGEPVEPRGRQARILLAYLVLHRHRPVRRDELVAAVWPGDARAGVEAHLAPLLSRLRKTLGADRLAGRDELTLILPEGAEVDWDILQRDVERARREAAGGDAAAGWDAASAAVTVADRGFLAGLEAPWIEELRTDLADLRVEALVLQARLGVALGGAQLAPAERAARAAVEGAPFRESARAALIEVLRAQGNIAEAVRAYEELRVLLREELGTPPGPELVALYETLLATEGVRPLPSANEARGQTPPAGRAPGLPDLVERERELHELGVLLAEAQSGQGRVALVEGPAGVGKTRLMAEGRRRAANAGVLALAARAGELERDFPFGVVRQLFEGELTEPDRRAALLAGAAAPAAPVFGAADPEGAGADSSFAVLHGLFWLVLNLANERPLLLAVDDLQWCDRPSLRFLAYLLR